MINKKGSHVAIILSLVIFIGFFIFLYTILVPRINLQQNQHIILNLLDHQLKEEFLANLTTVTFVVKESYAHGGDCLIITHPYGDGNLNVFVRNENSYMDFKTDSTYLYTAWSGDRFFKISYSEEEFDTTIDADGCVNIGEDFYDLGLIKSSEEFFETKILTYISYYNEEYEDLKTRLEIPDGKEFYFKFKYENGTEIGPNEKQTYGSVYAGQFNMEYITKKAKRETGQIGVWVW